MSRVPKWSLMCSFSTQGKFIRALRLVPSFWLTCTSSLPVEWPSFEGEPFLKNCLGFPFVGMGGNCYYSWPCPYLLVYFLLSFESQVLVKILWASFPSLAHILLSQIISKIGVYLVLERADVNTDVNGKYSSISNISLSFLQNKSNCCCSSMKYIILKFHSTDSNLDLRELKIF